MSVDYGVERFVSDPDHLSGVVRFDREKVPDVSGKAIEAARRLSGESSTPARFVVAELYDSVEWQLLPQMILCDDGLWRLPDGRGRMPFMWSVLGPKV